MVDQRMAEQQRQDVTVDSKNQRSIKNSQTRPLEGCSEAKASLMHESNKDNHRCTAAMMQFNKVNEVPNGDSEDIVERWNRRK